MIVRLWRGWTTPANAPLYETLLKEEIFKGIRSRSIPGFLSIELLTRNEETEVEFLTIMRFESLEAVREFAGDDYEVAVVPPAARKLLSRFDPRSLHYSLSF